MSALPLDVAAVLDEFNVGPLQVTRRSAPTGNEYGEATPASPVTVTLDPVAVYTATGRELLQVPEGDRHRETIAVHCAERLYVADGGQAADVIAYNGRSFRVVRVSDYELQGGVFLALAVLEDA